MEVDNELATRVRVLEEGTLSRGETLFRKFVVDNGRVASARVVDPRSVPLACTESPSW